MDWFFPSGGGHPGSWKVRRARMLCARCEVQVECLRVALAEDREGIWAGTTEEQRRRLQHPDPQVRLAKLLAVGRESCTMGPWRVASVWGGVE